MRLKSVYISEYKNLKEFKIPLGGNSFIDIFVGKNGTGKSNFFEALIEIFRHLFEFGGEDSLGPFNYKISYEIEGTTTNIEFKDEVLSVNGKVRKTMTSVPLPDNILTYYSGHNDNVNQLIKLYEISFAKNIKTASFGDTRKFIGVGPAYKELLLSILLMQDEGNKARSFICSKLGIRSVGGEVKLILKRPLYASNTSSNKFDIDDQTDPTQRYWRPEGITKTFLERLDLNISNAKEQEIRTEGYQSDEDRYIQYFNIAGVLAEFDDLSTQDLFQSFDNLKTLGMLDSITVPITLHEGVEASISHFSDGQFQSVYIYAISELFKDSNVISLLDEPDSFLHPEWQFDFLKQVIEITDQATNSNHVLMSSHSAVTLIPYDSPVVRFFDIKEGMAHSYNLPKKIAIKNLSSDLIKYSEHDSLLSIITTAQIQEKPILFTEGKSDPLIIKEAWYRLYSEDIPFIPFYGFGCGFLKKILTDNALHAELGGKPVFGLFDYDLAYDQWNGLNAEILNDNPDDGLIKQWNQGEAYGLMVPVPQHVDIRNQVINAGNNYGTFGNRALCEIEHLFYGDVSVSEYFIEEADVGGGKRIVFKSDSDKVAFAKVVVPKLKDNCFEVFKPMLEFIRSKC